MYSIIQKIYEKNNKILKGTYIKLTILYLNNKNHK